MALIGGNAPHIRSSDTTKTMYLDIILTLLALYIMAAFYYGFRAVFVGGISVLFAYFLDNFCYFIRYRKTNFKDLSPVVTGLIFPLLLPAAVPYFVIFIGLTFGIAVVKHIFGGFGEYIFNPSAASFAFVALCFTNRITQYSQPFDKLTLASEQAVNFTDGILLTIKNGGVPFIDKLDILLGNYAGPMGGTNVILITACLLYLLFRKAIRPQPVIGFILSVVFITFLFPRLNTRLDSVFYELFSGSVMFAATYLISESVTSTKMRLSGFVYGVLGGVFAMIFRYFGFFTYSTPFGILMVNAMSYFLDRYSYRILRYVGGKLNEK